MDREKQTTRVERRQLPEHESERDSLPETGTPAGTVWRSSTSPPPGSRSERTRHFPEPTASPEQRAEGNHASAALTEGERQAIDLAFDGQRLPPGDLTEESEYEESRDRDTGGEQALGVQAPLTTAERPLSKERGHG
jgi:hypothetical protein